MTPEEQARVLIDKMFDDAGWQVTDRDEYNPSISAVAIREGLLKGNLEADYLLFVDGKAVGVLEAKKAATDVQSIAVIKQAENYTHKVPSWCQTWKNPLPIVYVSNGKSTFWKNLQDTDSDYQETGRIHSPKELCRMLGINNFYSALPALKRKGLRQCQFEAITSLENSFRHGKNRALMVLATGAGKTYTACLAAYRMLSYTPMRRVLFLVDRNNLGKQAEGEFGMFRLTDNGEPFNTIFGVQRLKSAKIEKESNVVISTIQRLFSFLKGEDIDDTDEETCEAPEKMVELPDNPLLPKDFFDMIIIDECHRSIYGNWRRVLDYFSSAKMIGLTATPAPETEAFFDHNRIVNYTLEKSIVDGVNVDYRIYRIKTETTENGGAIRQGDKTSVETRYTGEVENVQAKEDRTYTKQELNRSIVNPAQIKLILETYRDAIYPEMFSDREAEMDYIPKTLIFALNDAHAGNIVKIAKEVFGRNDDTFVQKITYSAGDSNELIRHFRNDKDFRIAVTVTLVATGTDVKPLEVVMFMRDVESASLYTQMKGRGVRTIGDDQLRNVTPNAHSKDLFYLVDAVGVTEHEHIVTENSVDPKPAVLSFKELLERITHGEVSDDNLKYLAGKLSRLHSKCDNDQKDQFSAICGVDMKDLAANIYNALENNSLPLYIDINEPNNERRGLVSLLANSPKSRTYLLTLNAGFLTTILPGEDNLISKGFSMEEAQETAAAFEEYISTHKDEIEALRIIYNNQGEPLTYSMLKDLEQQLRMVNAKFNPLLLWNTYALLSPKRVSTLTTKDERDALTNIIQLVRFALKQIPELNSLCSTANRYYNLWKGQPWRDFTDKQKDILKQIVSYIASNGSATIDDIKDNDRPYAAQIIREYGGRDAANIALASLSSFLIYRKTA